MHELKYFMTLKTMLFNFAIMSIAPAIITCVLPFSGFYSGAVNLDHAVLVIALMIPRVPSNLIAYSVGGEKVYKTGESLLSTPLSIRTIFLAKCMIPVIVSTVMLAAASIATLAGINIIARLAPASVPSVMFSPAQMVLAFPVSILSCLLMVFISGTLSLVLKTPRQALYATSLIGFLFALPIIAITGNPQNVLIPSLIYCAVLLLCCAGFALGVSDKIKRPVITARL